MFKLALFTCALAASAFAQSQVGGATLNGTVTDASGAAVPNAKVSVANTGTGLNRSTQTTDEGLYVFTGLPVGQYDLSVDAQGFKAAKRTALQLEIGAAATIDVRLEVGSASETVSVVAEAPVVETTRTSAASNVTEKAVENLPVNGRNFIDFTLLTPGVVRDVRGGDLSFAGQRGTSNTLLVDGADSNNLFFGQATGRTGLRPYAFSEDAVQQFQVNTVGYPAEIGRAGGGAINVVTRSGTNQFHGSAFEFYRDRALNANTFVNNRTGARKGPYHFNQFGGTIGGPIKKDSLFFFFSYDGQRNTSNQIIAPNTPPTGAALTALQKHMEPYVVGLKNNVWLGKVDYNIGANDRLSVRYNASRYTGINQENASASSALEHTGDNQVNTDNLAALYTRVISASAVWDARFNWLRDNEPGFANGTGPEVSIVGGLIFGTNNFSPRYTNTRGYQTVQTVSFVSGRHSFKFGADLNFLRADNYFPGFFAGGYVFPSYAAYLANTPSQYTQAFSATGTVAPASHPNVDEYAFYIQDNWRVSDRLTVNWGLRYDLFDYAQPGTLNSNAQLTGDGLMTNRINVDKKNFGPRLGLAWRPFADDKTVVRAGYGIFYARTPGLALSTGILQNGIDVLTYTLTSNLPTYPNILSSKPAAGLAPPSIYVFDPSFHAPRVQQYNLQIERQIAGAFAVTLGYLGVHALHLTRSRDINLRPSVLMNGTIVGGGTVEYFAHPGAQGAAHPSEPRVRPHHAVRERRKLALQRRLRPTHQAVQPELPDADVVHVLEGDRHRARRDIRRPRQRGRRCQDRAGHAGAEPRARPRPERHPPPLRVLGRVGPRLRRDDREPRREGHRPRLVALDDRPTPIRRPLQHRHDRRSRQRREQRQRPRPAHRPQHDDRPRAHGLGPPPHPRHPLHRARSPAPDGGRIQPDQSSQLPRRAGQPVRFPRRRHLHPERELPPETDDAARRSRLARVPVGGEVHVLRPKRKTAPNEAP